MKNVMTFVMQNFIKCVVVLLAHELILGFCSIYNGCVILVLSIIYAFGAWQFAYSKKVFLSLGMNFYNRLFVLLYSVLFTTVITTVMNKEFGLEISVVTIGFFFIVYLAFWGIEYFWYCHLVTLGYFKKNTLLICKPENSDCIVKKSQNFLRTKDFFVNPDLKGDLRKFCMDNQISEILFQTNYIQLCDFESQIRDYCLEYNFSKIFFKIENDKVIITEKYLSNLDKVFQVTVKRIIDIFLSFLSLVILSPFFVAVSLLIAKEDGFPVIYRSTRIGMHGKKIKFLKFRSMIKDAEAKKKEIMKFNERPDGPLFKMKDDPRITPVGAFIRKTSIDELPQFWSVLKGDMSLIGPRPHLVEEVAEYQGADFFRLFSIPGIAGLPQIYGRDAIGFREWVDLDLKYINNWSLWGDCIIILKIMKVVLGLN